MMLYIKPCAFLGFNTSEAFEVGFGAEVGTENYDGNQRQAEIYFRWELPRDLSAIRYWFFNAEYDDYESWKFAHLTILGFRISVSSVGGLLA